jgi:two-component system, sensor histidine kinase
VLLLDPSAQDAERISAILEQDAWHFALTWVAERTALEAALAGCSFDLILAEYALPESDGLVLLELVRQRHPGVPLIFVTNVRGEDIVVEALKRGAADYVLKARLERLCPAMRQAVREKDDRQAEAEALKTSRRKDEFLGQLGHELRNPLAALSNATALWRRKAHDPAMQQWCQEVVERQTQNLMRLVDEMVDLSRVLRGVIRLSRQALEVGPLVHRVVQAMRAQAVGRGLRLSTTNEAPGVQVDADEARLERVLGTLLRNAVQCAAEGGQVEVAIRRHGPMVNIVVQDDGIGMPAEVVPRVFDLFARMEHSQGRSHGGLGVSLTVARRLVELHGGTLTAASPGPGEGSTFTIQLEAVADPARSSDETGPPVESGPDAG